MATGNRTLKLSILADVDDLKKKLGQGEQEVQRIFKIRYPYNNFLY